MKKYLERAWYFGGWSDELAAGAAKQVVLAEHKLAVYRGETGTVAAIDDRCPHRFAPLHRGHVRGDLLQCGYHGIEFARDGRCVFNPHIRSGSGGGLGVDSYHVLERDSAIWVWLSTEHEPDPSLMPDMSDLVTYPVTARTDLPTMVTQADYRLIVDNLLDPTHAEYLHRGVLGGTGELENKKPHVSVSGSSVDVDWLYEGAIAIPLFEMFRPEAESVDSWISVRWSAPGVVRFAAGVMPSGQDHLSGQWAVVYHILMPTSHGMTAYDARGTRNFALDSIELSQQIGAALQHAFMNEDKPMIEAQSAMMDERGFWDLKPALFPTDEPAVRVRRAHDALLEQENLALV